MIRARVHVKEGVERGLCGSCQFGLTRRFDNSNQTTTCVYLGTAPHEITRRVEECSGYREKTGMALWQMQEMAWILEVKKGQPAGFVSPQQLKDSISRTPR